MTVRQLIKNLQDLEDKYKEKEVIMFDGPSYYTPYRVKYINDESLGKHLKDKVMID